MPSQSRTEDDASGNTQMILGELRGQMREVIHTLNNLRVTVDGLSREVGALTILATDVGDLKVRMKDAEGWMQRRDTMPDTLTDIDARLRVVEQEKAETKGAKGLLNWLAHSPIIGWLAAALAIAWDRLTGVAP